MFNLPGPAGKLLRARMSGRVPDNALAGGGLGEPGERHADSDDKQGARTAAERRRRRRRAGAPGLLSGPGMKRARRPGLTLADELDDLELCGPWLAMRHALGIAPGDMQHPYFKYCISYILGEGFRRKVTPKGTWDSF